MFGIIYKITSKIEKNSYIGQTIYTIKKRWAEHCYKTSTCRLLHNAIEKYGKENFEIKVLSYCNSMEEMNHREQYYIKLFNTLAPNGYNLMVGGKNSLMSEETKRKMSTSQKGIKKPKTAEHREKIRKTLTGRKQSAELIEKRIRPLVGRKRPTYIMEILRQSRIGKKHTKEAKEKISKAGMGRKGAWKGKIKSKEHIEKIAKGHRKSLYVPELNKTFSSIKETAIALNIYTYQIHSMLRGECSSVKGYTFQRA